MNPNEMTILLMTCEVIGVSDGAEGERQAFGVLLATSEDRP